jgi:uncharacterized protein YeaO (DUF488 family)
MSQGTITDTYVAALQHDLVDLEEDTQLVGVVRQPTRWFNPRVDENITALAPPEDLFIDFQVRRDQLETEGQGEEEAHNQAWTDVDYDRRYREHIETTPAAQAAVEKLLGRVESGANIALVCYENTDHKRCHRTVLRAYLETELEQC